MHMMKNILVPGILMICIVSGTAIPVFGASEKVTVVTDNGYPPYSFGITERAEGLYPMLIKTIFARMGITVKIIALPWEKAIKEGKEGNAAVGGIYINSERLKIFDYSEPIFEEKLAVYVKKGKTFDFNRLSDLKGKIIGLNSGWSYGEAFDTARIKYHFNVVESETNEQSFHKLVRGSIDCLIADQVAASQIIRQENLSDQVERLDKLAAVDKAYVVFVKSLKKQHILEKFNQALEEMKKDGSYRKIIQDFVTSSSE